MAGLICAKIIIDRGELNTASNRCVMAVADIFREKLEDKPTQEALAFLQQADELTHKALHVLEKSLGIPVSGYDDKS